MIPRGAEEGDAICILLGSQVAHILRPVPEAQTPNTFKIIGIAYIHGFMDREILMCKKGEFKEEILTSSESKSSCTVAINSNNLHAPIFSDSSKRQIRGESPTLF